MLVDTRVYAAVESIQPTLPTISTETVSKQGTQKADDDNKSAGFDPTLPDESAAAPPKDEKVPLQGSTSYLDVSAKFSDTVHRLTKFALERDPEYEKTARAVDHYRTKVQRAVRFAKDAVNYAYPYRGFSMSIEGSRVITDKKQKLNNLFIAELTKQRYWDELHPKIMAKIMQIAMGLGLEKPELADVEIQKGVAGLKELVGEETAQTTLAELSEWKNELKIPETVFEESTRDVDTTERIYANTLKISADGDPLIAEVFKRVKKFDHGMLANCAAGVIEAQLSAVTVLSGNPGVSLAAEGLSTAFVMSTGGPEENKILKELYYGRRLEIRRKRISDEAELALVNYEKALLTHNAPQLAMSEVVLAQLVGPERIATVLECQPITDCSASAPIELGKVPSPDQQAALLPSNPNIAPGEYFAPAGSNAEFQQQSPDVAPNNPNNVQSETVAPKANGAATQMPPTFRAIERANLARTKLEHARKKKIAIRVTGAVLEKSLPTESYPHYHVYTNHKTSKPKHRHWGTYILDGHAYTTYGF
jgi:hypothetical protein